MDHKNLLIMLDYSKVQKNQPFKRLQTEISSRNLKKIILSNFYH